MTLLTLVNKNKLVLLLFWSLLLYASGNSQTFPVQVNPQVVPPYSLKLSEYGTGTSEKLVLNLLLTDISEFNRQVRLKLTIENNAGLSVQNTEAVVGARPIFIDGGTPLRLSNVDLQPYFSLQNLTGITPQQYNTPFPEGLYRFCFEVFDAISGKQISRKSCATAYLVLNDPPFLNIPNRGEQVTIKDPQNIIFQWTPRHLNATNVEYEFTLVELWDTGMNPQAAFLASRPLYQTTTFAATLLYGPGEPQLLPDKNYGWRVRAMVSDGVSETSVFKNDGYSEIYHFTYADTCKEPEYVLAEAKNPTSEKILWQGVDHKRYNVQYCKASTSNTSPSGGGQEGAVWFDSGTVNSYTTLYSLEPGTTYEFRVGGQCLENGPYTYSQIYQFTTIIPGDDESATFNCGITPEVVITNQDPLETLVINDTFTAGDFPVTVKEVSYGNVNSSPGGGGAGGGQGVYSGWGYIVVPYLEDTKIKVSFNGIKINSDYQLIEGIVQTDYDENWGGVDDVSNEVDALLDLGDAIVQITTTAITTGIDKIKELADKVKELLTANEDLTEEEVVVLEEKIERWVEAKEIYDTATTEEEKEAAQEVYEETQEEIAENIDIPDTDNPDTEGEGGEEAIVKIWFAGDNMEYTNGETISVGYDADDLPLAFRLKNYSDSTKVFNWQLFHSGMDKTIEVKSNEPNLDNFGLNLKGRTGDIKLKVTYDTKEIEVILQTEKEEFALTELKATHKKNRVAKAGEILYLVPAGLNNTEKLVTYKAKFNPNLGNDKYAQNDVIWSYKDQTVNKNLQQFFGMSSIKRSITESETPLKTYLDAGYPTKSKLNVDVKWVNSDRQRIDVANKLGPLLKAFDKINYVTKKFKSVGLPCSISVLEDLDRLIGQNQIKISYETYNEEEINNRLYKNVDKFKFIATGAEIFNLKCGKDITVPIPFTNKEITLAGANISISAGLKGTIEINREKQIETDEISYGKSKVSGAGYLKPRITATLIGVDGKIDIEAGIRFEYPYKGNAASVGLIFYSSDSYGYVSISKDASVFVTNDFRYDLFRLDTSTSFELYELNLNELTN